MRVDQLDGYVWQSVCELLQNPARMLDEWSRRQKSDGVPTELRECPDEAVRDLAIHERSLKRLVDAYEVGAIDLKELKVRSDAVRARIERARRDLDDADRKLRETVHLRAVVTQLEEFAARVRKGLDTVSWHDKRHIIRTLVAKVELDETGATVVYRLPSTEPAPGAEISGGGGTAGPVTSYQLREGRDLSAAQQHRAGRARPRARTARPPLRALRGR